MNDLSFIRMLATVCILTYCSNFQLYNGYVINNLVDVIQKWLSQFTDNRQAVVHYWSILISAMMFGQIFGPLAAVPLAERLGRKWALIICSMVFFLGGGLVGFAHQANSYCMFLIGRFLLGFSYGFAVVIPSLWITESAPRNRRGFFGSFQQYAGNVSAVTANLMTLPGILNSTALWPYAMIIGTAPFLLILPILIFWIPDSPRFIYFKRNNEEHTKKSITFYQGPSKVPVVLAELEHESQQLGSNPTESIIHFIKMSVNRGRVIICFALTGLQHVDSDPLMEAYSTAIMMQAGLTLKQATIATLSASVTKLITSPSILSFSDRTGRRWPILISSYISAISNLTIALTFGLCTKGLTAGVLVAVSQVAERVMHGIYYGSGIVVVGEILEQNMRAKMMAANRTISYAIAFCFVLIFMPLSEWIGYEWCFIFCFFMTLTRTILCQIYLPETTGQHLGRFSNRSEAEEIPTEETPLLENRSQK